MNERADETEFFDAINFADAPCDAKGCLNSWTQAESAFAGDTIVVAYLCDEHASKAGVQ